MYNKKKRGKFGEEKRGGGMCNKIEDLARKREGES